MSKIIDLTGRKYGKLLVICRKASNSKGNSMWECKCDCGKITVVSSNRLRSGNTKSCGCTHGESHGMANTRIYRIWQAIKNRCLNKNVKAYIYYGGRGITICEEWIKSFNAFYEWAISNGYADNLTIDRINVNGNYEPLNCRWVEMKTQNNNTRHNKFITKNGETHTITEWAEIIGIKPATLYARIYVYKWDIEKALKQ